MRAAIVCGTITPMLTTPLDTLLAPYESRANQFVGRGIEEVLSGLRFVERRVVDACPRAGGG